MLLCAAIDAVTAVELFSQADALPRMLQVWVRAQGLSGNGCGLRAASCTAWLRALERTQVHLREEKCRRPGDLAAYRDQQGEESKVLGSSCSHAVGLASTCRLPMTCPSNRPSLYLCRSPRARNLNTNLPLFDRSK